VGVVRLFLAGALIGLAVAGLAMLTLRPGFATDPALFLTVLSLVFGFTTLAIWGGRPGRWG
jgi:hypothetical protein